MCDNCTEKCQKPCANCTCDKKKEAQKRSYANRKAREQVMRDMGLVKVRGALGGVYWE
jgi:hypothetical protein